MLSMFQRRVGASSSALRVARSYAGESSSSMNRLPFFESLNDVTTFIRNEADHLDANQLAALAYKMPLMFRKAGRREESDMRQGEDFSRLLSIMRGHVERSDGATALKMFNSASILCPFSNQTMHPEFKKMGESMWRQINDGRIAIPAHEWATTMTTVTKFMDRDVQIAEVIKREAPDMIPQLDAAGCIQVLRLLGMGAVRDNDVLTAAFGRIFELRDTLTNRDIEQLMREAAAVGFLPFNLAQHCRGILLDHSSMFQYRQLAECFRNVIDLSMDDTKLHKRLVEEIQNNFDPMNDAANSSLVKALTKAHIPEKELAARIIGAVTSRDGYLHTWRFSLNIAYAICTFQLLEFKAPLEKAIANLLQCPMMGGNLICLKEVLECAKIDFGMKIMVKDSIATEMDIQEAKWKSELTPNLEEIYSSCEDVFRFDLERDVKLGPYVVPFADTKAKVAIIVDRDRDQYGPRIRTRQLEAMGYNVARVRFSLWRRAKYDDFKRDALEMALTPVAVAVGRMTAAEAESRRMKRLAEAELRRASTSGAAEAEM